MPASDTTHATGDERWRALERQALTFDVPALEQLLAIAERLEDRKLLWRVDHLAYLLYLRVIGQKPSPDEERGQTIWPLEWWRYHDHAQGSRWEKLWEIAFRADRVRDFLWREEDRLAAARIRNEAAAVHRREHEVWA